MVKRTKAPAVAAVAQGQPQKSSATLSAELKTLLDLLAKLAAGDSWHDFHGDISGVGKIIRQNEDKYISGLPGGTLDDKFEDEDVALSRVVSKIGGVSFENFGNYSNFGDYLTGDGLEQAYTIETVNQNQYSVRSIITSKGKKKEGTKEVIDSYQFVNTLDIEDESAIIIDATAVSIMDILTSDSTNLAQKKEMNERKVYYIMAPELINDPAGKSAADDSIFYNNSGKVKGVKLISCVPNSPPSLNYNYTFNNVLNTSQLSSDTTSAYDKFFTAYNFQLSEIQPVRKGLKTEMTTNLLINAKIQGKGYSENVLDSKKKNKIPYLKSLLINIIKTFTSNKEKDKQTFLFNTNFQQKRSGDWLQVLLCLALKGRAFKIYRKPGKPQVKGDTDVEKQFTHVYFVTHDRIALAFALLCGVECIFTHARSHAAYIFKQASASAIEAERIKAINNKNASLTKIISNLGNPANTDTCADCKEEISTYYSLIKPKIATYQQFRTTDIINNFENEITKVIPNKYPFFKPDGNNHVIKNDVSSFSVKLFSNFTSELFGKCLMYSFLLLNFPDLTNQNTEISTNLQVLRGIVTLAAAAAVNNGLTGADKEKNQTDVIKQKDEAIALYGKIIGDINSLDSTLSSYFVVATAANASNLTLSINMANTFKSFQKTPSYKLAAGWNWENTSGNNRIWDAFKNVAIGSKNLDYKSDKNAFLYNLDNLPEHIKNFLNVTYVNILNGILNNASRDGYVKEPTKADPNTTISPNRLPKFLLSAKGFCAEVLLNFPETTKITVSPSTAKGMIKNVSKRARQSGGTGGEDEDEDEDEDEAEGDVDIEVVTDDCIDAVKRVMRINSDLNFFNDDLVVAENSISTENMLINHKADGQVSCTADRYSTEKVSELNVEESNLHPLTDSNTRYDYEPGGPVIIQSGGDVNTRTNTSANLVSYSDAIKQDSIYNPTTENDIKSATYVLLNANLDFKPPIQAVKQIPTTMWEYITSLGNKTKEVPDNGRNYSEIKQELNSMEEKISEEEQIGGSGTPSASEESEKIDALRELVTDLDLKPASEEEQIPEDADLFTATNEYYHPMLPIYMMAESLNEVAQNDAVDESLEYNLFLNYLNYLTQLRETLHASYASKNRLDVVCAFVIGEGLKELLFDSDVNDLDMEQAGGQLTQPYRGSSQTQTQTVEDADSIEDVKRRIQNKEGIPIDQQRLIFPGKDVGEGPAQSRFLPPSEEPQSLPPVINSNLYCEAVMGISEDNFKPVSILTGILKNVISGYKYRTPKEIEDGKIVLKNPIFSDYIKKVNMSDIFSVEREVYEPIKTFKERTFRFLIETGNIIISDRGGVPVNLPPQAPPQASPQASAEIIHPDAAGLREIQANSAETRMRNAGQEEMTPSSSPPEFDDEQQRLALRKERANKMLEATSRRGLGGSKKYRRKNNRNTRKNAAK